MNKKHTNLIGGKTIATGKFFDIAAFHIETGTMPWARDVSVMIDTYME